MYSDVPQRVRAIVESPISFAAKNVTNWVNFKNRKK